MSRELKMFDLAKKIKALIYVDAKIIRGKNTLGSPKERIPDMKKTIKATKLKTFVTLDDGLRKTVDWYLQNS